MYASEMVVVGVQSRRTLFHTKRDEINRFVTCAMATDRMPEQDEGLALVNDR
jgi:hypothetical protein